MAEQHVKLMEQLGIDKTLIEEVEKIEPEKVKDWDHSKVVDSVKKAFKTQFMEDAEFINSIPEEKFPVDLKKKLETGQATRFQNEMKEVAMKELGLEENDFVDLSKGQKDSVIKAMVKLIANKHLEKKGNVEGLKEMQKNLQEMTANLEKKDAEWKEKMDKELEKVNGTGQARIVKALTKVELSSLEGVELSVPPGYVTDQLLARLQSKYAILVGDNDELLLRQKSNPELKVLDGSKEVTFAEALKKQVLEDKVGKAIDEKEEKKKKKVVVGNDDEEKGDDFEVPAYIGDKAKAIIDLEKE